MEEKNHLVLLVAARVLLDIHEHGTRYLSLVPREKKCIHCHVDCVQLKQQDHLENETFDMHIAAAFCYYHC